MKTVGIFTRIDTLNNKSIHYVPSDIIYKLHKKVKIKLIYFTLEDTLKNIIEDLKCCDGIILPGGDDIYDIELEVCNYAYQNNIPLLGICLGMQTMSYVFSGVMKELSDESHKANKRYVHQITINKESLLYKILKEDKISVNSRHKDYILNTNLFIGAKATDGIIEEVEDPSKKFFVGVQWHPENLNDKYANRLFSYFISVL